MLISLSCHVIISLVNTDVALHVVTSVNCV